MTRSERDQPSGKQTATAGAGRLDARARDSASVDTSGIFRSVGDVAYEWTIETDELNWSDNVGAVLGLTDISKVSTGRGYANLLAPGSAKSRYDAVVKAAQQGGAD